MTSGANERLLDRAREVSAGEDLQAAIVALSAANRKQPDARLEQELLRLRHQAFLTLERKDPVRTPPGFAEAIAVDEKVGLPVTEKPVTVATLRNAIESHGSLIVRGFLDRDQTSRLKHTVESALAAREEVKKGGESNGWYSEFPTVGEPLTRWFTSFAGLLAADSPRGLFQVFDVFSEAGIDKVAAEFLGGRPVLSVEKSVFRCAQPQPSASWHQDGAFLGEDIRSLDVWIALSPCGRTAPGLEIVSRRIDRVLPTGKYFSWDLAEEVIAEHYPDHSKVMPEFEPGDAILFDQLCVHRTGHKPGMTDQRLALECWLFAAGTLPAKYTGLVL